MLEKQEPDARGRGWRSYARSRQRAAQHSVTSTKAPSYVTIVPSTGKAEHPCGPGKGKLFIGSRCVFTEQPKRMDAELRGIKLRASTGTFVQVHIRVYP